MFKMSKVKGGRIKLAGQMGKLKKKGGGTPAVKKNYDEVEAEIQQIQNPNPQPVVGEGAKKRIKNIKPLVFKL